MFENIVYPGSILIKIIKNDPKAWDKIVQRADGLFEQEKKSQYREIIEDKASVPNPITMVRNFLVRSYNRALEKQQDVYFQPSMLGYETLGSFSPESYRGPMMMSRNLAKALLLHIESERHKIVDGALITREDLHYLRSYVGWDNSAKAQNLENHA